MKTPRGASESSTTSDNTTEFIDIVKKYDVVYNTHNPDYKNVEVKMKVWSQIAEEIGLSVAALTNAGIQFNCTVSALRYHSSNGGKPQKLLFN
ncbi:unnamed protein product [Ceratitis capitata]|uniref:(Mediterranean fruit fly) hypothetical protein n=1 Tax=Ceratitis capitata TaxID=7213 RepID=A0A811VE46_CERCA|nr:unnamed protein product [Ceratitis capitata]